MGAGSYDHPSYLTRQQLHLGVTTAGSAGTSARSAYTNDMRIRNVIAVVQTAGTSATTGHALTIQSGTTSIGSITLGTTAQNGTATSGDLNTKITAGTVLSLVNGTDATGVARVTAEMQTDAGATWVGN